MPFNFPKMQLAAQLVLPVYKLSHALKLPAGHGSIENACSSRTVLVGLASQFKLRVIRLMLLYHRPFTKTQACRQHDECCCCWLETLRQHAVFCAAYTATPLLGW